MIKRTLWQIYKMLYIIFPYHCLLTVSELVTVIWFPVDLFSEDMLCWSWIYVICLGVSIMKLIYCHLWLQFFPFWRGPLFFFTQSVLSSYFLLFVSLDLLYFYLWSSWLVNTASLFFELLNLWCAVILGGFNPSRYFMNMFFSRHMWWVQL